MMNGDSSDPHLRIIDTFLLFCYDLLTKIFADIFNPITLKDQSRNLCMF